MTLELLDLPNECISAIFSALDLGSPFAATSITNLPGIPVKAENPPLKNCSLLSHRLRKIALPILFHHTSLNPRFLKSFLAFLNRNSLTSHVVSVAAHLPSPCSHYHPPWWHTMLSELPSLTTIGILAPPHIFAEITARATFSPESWAFSIKYQIMSLSAPPSSPSSSSWPTSSQSFSSTTTTTTITTTAAAAATTALPSSLLEARPWTSLTLNEASSLTCYNTHEYFLRRPPSPIYSIPPTVITATALSPQPNAFLANLRSFSYIAIFPICTHVEAVLLRVKQMTNLRRLFVKLGPDPDSTALDNALSEDIDRFDINDLGAQFEASLSAIGNLCTELSPPSPLLDHMHTQQEQHANSGGGGGGGGDNDNDNDDADGIGARMVLPNLEVLEVDDAKMLGIKDAIEDRLNLHLARPAALGWTYEGNGVWRRRAGNTGMMPAISGGGLSSG